MGRMSGWSNNWGRLLESFFLCVCYCSRCWRKGEEKSFGGWKSSYLKKCLAHINVGEVGDRVWRWWHFILLCSSFLPFSLPLGVPFLYPLPHCTPGDSVTISIVVSSQPLQRHCAEACTATLGSQPQYLQMNIWVS